jgi:hypothetical protein
MVLVVEGRLLLNSDLVTLSVICDNFTTQEKKLAFTFMQWTTSNTFSRNYSLSYQRKLALLASSSQGHIITRMKSFCLKFLVCLLLDSVIKIQRTFQ